ncbi:Hemolysin [Mycetohabitans rhizoxinica HKI 454]|uniref:Hemolysin n=3 Tax=Mycetohabitans TaxID=2571159 RepID=E5ARN2_MYCRK|nr:Hemolysin [Mycetohabitans rhizoxinica HKI 454]
MGMSRGYSLGSSGRGEDLEGVGTTQSGQAATGAEQVPGSKLPSTPGGFSVAPPSVMAASGKASSTTLSGISAGTIRITDEAQQQALTGQDVAQSLAGLNQQVWSGQDGDNALKPIFDKQKIQAGFEMANQLTHQIGTFVGHRQAQLDEAQQAAQDPNLSPQARAQAQQQAAQLKAQWGPGGTYRRALSALGAAAGGNVTAGAGQFALSATVNYVQGLAASEVKRVADGLQSEEARAALHALVGCAGAAASRQDCGAGAMGAAASSMLGTLLGPTQGLTQRQKEAQTNLVSSLVAAVAGMAGQDTPAVTTAAVTEGRFNRQLHPQERKWISDREAVYAKRYGLSAEQAREELTIQANLQIQNGSPGEWNQRAHEFLRQAHGMMPADGDSGPGYMFYATPEQKADPGIYVGYYPDGMGLNAPSPEAINASMNRDAASREVIAKQTLGAAAGAAAIAVGGPVAALPGAPIFSSEGALGSGMWASPVGTGIISGGINAGSQYLQNGTVNPVDVATSFSTGMAGAYGGLLWNMGVNAAGGAARTALNNAMHGKSDSVTESAVTSGLLSSLGYGIGKLGESGVNSAIKSTINTPNWTGTGVWAGSGWNLFRPNNFGPIGGSIGGASGQEIIDAIYQQMRSQPGGRNDRALANLAGFLPFYLHRRNGLDLGSGHLYKLPIC